MFSRADFVCVAMRLSGISGRFNLSVDKVPETRKAFARLAIEGVATRYTIAGGNWSDVAEIVVTGPTKEPMPPAPDLWSL